jgi:hypothetical protein
MNSAICFAGAGGNRSTLKREQQPSTDFAMIHVPTTQDRFF